MCLTTSMVQQYTVPRRRRFEDGGTEEEARTAAVGCGCRSSSSCAAVVLADCVALGCCPCAVVSLLGLALVRAPLAVCRRCVRRRRRMPMKPVRHVASAAAASTITSDDLEKSAKAEETGRVVDAGGLETTAGASDEEELAWLEEMYRTGQWGFGRVSLSANTP